MPKFGDIGTEETPLGESRKVMYLAPDRVVMLTTLEEDPSTVRPGEVTYALKRTKWIDPETAENDE